MHSFIHLYIHLFIHSLWIHVLIFDLHLSHLPPPGYSLKDAEAGYRHVFLQSDEHLRHGHIRKRHVGNRHVEGRLPDRTEGRDYNPWGDGKFLNAIGFL